MRVFELHRGVSKRSNHDCGIRACCRYVWGVAFKMPWNPSTRNVEFSCCLPRQGITLADAAKVKGDDPRLTASALRNAALQTFGNLTILTQELNSSVSNGPWHAKRPEFLQCSLLPINQDLHESNSWDESQF
jgi:hypothetical protein